MQRSSAHSRVRFREWAPLWRRLGTASGPMEKKGQRQQGSGDRETRRQRSKIEQQVESRINNQNQSMIVHPALHQRHDGHSTKCVCLCVCQRECLRRCLSKTTGDKDPSKYMRLPSAKPAILGVGSFGKQPQHAAIHDNQQAQVAKPWGRQNHPITLYLRK